MPSERAFRIPRAHKDHVQPRQLMAIAATCMSVGVALSGVLAAKQRERASNEHEYAWQSAAAGPALPSLEDAQLVIAAALERDEPKPSAQSSTETSISAATSAAAASPERVTETPTKKPSKTAKTTLVRGAVTYRCDAAAQRSAKGCPHDRALEARAFRVLVRLSSCRAASDALGHADLKLWIEPLAPTRVVFAASAISPSLNLRAVSQCVARDLSKLRATRKADRFELSLSFGLAARN
jgi:hypothetical protein